IGDVTGTLTARTAVMRSTVPLELADLTNLSVRMAAASMAAGSVMVSETVSMVPMKSTAKMSISAWALENSNAEVENA
uniref:Uncharacterized protein n=1 Tax=Colobus angolensis palliatus TaxID=336983 RepID=A0A2K5HD38_COLAP